MKLLMTTTLGTADAKRFELEGAKEGETVDAKTEVGEELIRRKWAVAAPAPRLDIKGASEKSLVSPPTGAPSQQQQPAPTPVAGSFDDMTKEQLQEYADAHKIQGVSLAMSKDHMIQAVRKVHPAPKALPNG